MSEIDILEQQAVDAAINQDWVKALSINKKILKISKENLDALLRLGFAYFQSKDLKEAKKYYKKALRIQSGNLVAQENIDRIKILENVKTSKAKLEEVNFDPNLFIEIPGRTRSVHLVNLGQKDILAKLLVGQQVYLNPKKRKIEIRTKAGEFIGFLPDDLSKRLFLFMKAESGYISFIKEVSLTRVVVFIKEEKKGKKVFKYISFPKNTQTDINEMTATSNEDDAGEHEEESIDQLDIEKMAENLSQEDKDYYHHFESSEGEDEENIEE